MYHALAFGVPMGWEWIIIAGLGLLIFGKRLPEVGKSLGQGIVQFKKGLKSVEEDVEQVDATPTPTKQISDAAAAGVQPQYKFDPYTGKPVEPVHKFDPYTGKPVESDAAASESKS